MRSGRAKGMQVVRPVIVGPGDRVGDLLSDVYLAVRTDILARF